MAPDTDPIVITGMGAVSPLGIGVDANWRALMEGKSGIVMNDRFDVTEFGAKIAGLVPKEFDPTTAVDPKDIKKMDLFIQYGLVAAAEALAQSGWVADTARMVAGCPCADGCPSCVQSPKCGNLNDMLDKAGARLFLERLAAAT